MIRCTEKDKDEILRYIGGSYGECLYLYVDLLKYGTDSDNVNVWMQKRDGRVTAVILQYYTGVHVFSKNADLDPSEAAELIRGIDPSMICGMKRTLDKIRSWFPHHEMEEGTVAELTGLAEYDTEGCCRADEDDIRELAAFLSEDEALGRPYGYDLLYRQLLERYNEGFGRNYILRGGDGKIIATASTYAEKEKVAVISGVMVDERYRGKGLSLRVLSAICRELKDEGFDVFSYYYITPARRMHESAGFTEIGRWAKLVRKEGDGDSDSEQAS